MTGEILRTGVEFAANGICAVPVATDGSKRPALANWKLYQERLPSPEELVTWFANAEGVGVICGKVSGNLEMLELEGRAVADKMHLDLKEMANNAGLGGVWDRINNGYVEMTPSGGLHWLYRIDGIVLGNTVRSNTALLLNIKFYLFVFMRYSRILHSLKSLISSSVLSKTGTF